MLILLHTILLARFASCRNSLPPHLNYSLSEGARRKLQETTPRTNPAQPWEPLRLQYEFLLDFNEKEVEFLKKVLLVAKAFFEKHYLVRRKNKPLVFPESRPRQWFGVPLSQKILESQYEADIVFFINIDNDPNSNYLAYASPKIFDEDTKRPTMSFISWNIAYQNVFRMNNVNFNEAVQIALHEMTHGLGFVKEYLSNYYDSRTDSAYKLTPLQVDHQGKLILTTPRIVALTQRHFNCSTATGLPLEDGGGQATSGSHFERTLLSNELMTGSLLTGDFIVSDFTFQLMQDTGFYRLAEYEPDTLEWGKNQGCAFLHGACAKGSFPEFCTDLNEESCTHNRRGIGECRKWDFLANDCSYQMMRENFFCADITQANPRSATYQYFGYDSLCFEGSLSKSEHLEKFSCYQYRCSDENVLIVIIDGNEIHCLDGQPVSIPAGYKSNFKCPANPHSFCKEDIICPNHCSSRGYCLKGQCTCIEGFAGKSCETPCKYLRYKHECVEECPTGSFQAGSYCIGCPAGCLDCSGYNRCIKCRVDYTLAGDFCDLNPVNLEVNQEAIQQQRQEEIFYLAERERRIRDERIQKEQAKIGEINEKVVQSFKLNVESVSNQQEINETSQIQHYEQFKQQQTWEQQKEIDSNIENLQRSSKNDSPNQGKEAGPTREQVKTTTSTGGLALQILSVCWALVL